MFRSTVAKLFSAVLSLTCAAGATLAQTGPQTQTPPPMQPMGQQAPSGAAGISEESLTAFLRTLDAGVQINRGQNNSNVYYRLNVQRNNWRFVIDVHLYPKRVLLLCNLGQPISDPRQLSSERLVKMMEFMNKIGPSYFTYDRVNNGQQLQLALNHMLDRTVSMDRLRAGLEEFLKDIQDSYPVWGQTGN